MQVLAGATASKNDAYFMGVMTAEYAKQNAKTFKNMVGRWPTAAETIAAHNVGAGNAVKLAKASGNENAVKLLGSAARNNPKVYYDNGKPRTVSGVLNWYGSLVRTEEFNWRGRD